MVSHAPGMMSSDPCPHIETNDVRCGHRFSLMRMEQAFGVCMGAYHGCPMFHRINREQSDDADRRLRIADLAEGAAPAPLITVTRHGQHLALRPTGT